MARVWSVFEPILLLVLAGLLTRAVLPLIGADGDAAAEALLRSDPPDWSYAAAFEARLQALRWGLLLPVVWALSRRRDARLLHPAGTVPAKWTLLRRLSLGLAVGVLLQQIATLPRWYHYRVSSLGEARPIWDVIFSSDWSPAFWIYMAIGSFALVPVVEELYFRGYVFGHLLRHFSPRWAIVLSASIFAAVHLQYARADLFLLINGGLVFLFAIVTAGMVYLTGSLLPAVVAHAYCNVPHPVGWFPLELVLLAPAIVVLWRLWSSIEEPHGPAAPG